MHHPTRRQLLATTAALLTAPSLSATPPTTKPTEPFRYCLNTATIQGQNLPILDEIELTAKTGFHAIDPWVSQLDKHKQSGKSLTDVKKSLSDNGLQMPSAIGFAEWIVDDESRRAPPA